MNNIEAYRQSANEWQRHVCREEVKLKGFTRWICLCFTVSKQGNIHMPSLTLAASFPQVGEVLIKKKNWDRTMKNKAENNC